MSRLKILNVAGARPQFIKMAVVSRALAQFPEIEEIIVHSGQHSQLEMSQVFFDELQIPTPHYNLGISGTGKDDVVDRMQTAFAALIKRVQPDWVLVYGDTYTTRAAAQAAHHANVKLAHVEAGLRSFNPEMPEEFNRIVADRLSSVLFAPTQRAVDQLWDEGLGGSPGKLKLVGDVMYDAVKQYKEQAQRIGDFPSDVLPGQFLLCTIHRAETTDNPEKLAAVVAALNRLSEKYKIVLPLHPRTEKRMKTSGLRFVFPAHPPQGYLPMLHLLHNCSLVLTDSGGLQKEAYFSHKFCVTLRNETEWTELIDSGYNTLTGADENEIVESVAKMLSKKGRFDEQFYGDGTAALKIARFFAEEAGL